MAVKTKARKTAAVVATTPTPLFQTVAQAVRDWFASATAGAALFTTNAEGLWDAYLAGLAPADRQEHNCAACRRFIEEFGGLVVITEEGKTLPAMWGHAATSLYESSIEALDRIVSRAKVTGVYLSSAEVWGQPVTGEWSHFAVKHPAPYAGAVLSPRQAMAEKIQDCITVIRALEEFPMATLATAVNVLQSDALYRSEKCLGAAEWLLALSTMRATTRKPMRENLTWRAIASAPAGFCHPRSGMIGTLLEDISAGLPFATIAARFAEKMNPSVYQRPTAAPAAGNIQQAEKLVEKLGIAPSLRRRFARVDEVEALWLPPVIVVAPPAGGVFGHLLAKTAAPPALVVPPVTMTWVKFAAEVLPAAEKIEFRVPTGVNHYGSLVTAADPDAPPILQWDDVACRNPVSWYVYGRGSSPTGWGLHAGEYRAVTAVCLQPTMWNGRSLGHMGDGAFFLLADAWDRNYKGCGNALFPEILKAELHSVRATLEAYSKGAVIEGGEVPVACGLRLQKGVTWSGAVFRVTGAGGVRTYCLDRWD